MNSCSGTTDRRLLQLQLQWTKQTLDQRVLKQLLIRQQAVYFEQQLLAEVEVFDIIIHQSPSTPVVLGDTTANVVIIMPIQRRTRQRRSSSKR